MFVLLLAGCWDTNEPERMIYVHGLGIDYEDGKYNLYLQIVNPTLLAKSESTGGQTDTKVIVGHGTGETINEAIFDVYKSSQRRIFWGHLSYFVFTENVLKKEGLKAAIDLFDRYRETRYNTWVYTTKEPLFPLLTVLPPLEMSTALSQLSDPYPKYRQNSIIRPVSLRELLILLNEPPHIATIPYVGLTKKHTWETDKKSIKTIELIGATFISEDTFKKSFLIEEIEGIKWMNEDLTREELKLKNELSHVSLLIDNIKIEKKPIIKNNKIHFQISIKVLAKLREIVKRENLNKIEKETEKLLKSQIQETFRKGLEHELDVFRLSEVLYRQDVNAWKAVEQNGKIPLTKDSLQLSINVKLINGEKQRKMPTLE
ncbi:MAG TPA: Ger(x)C family spore germination protein [Bacillus bacterium]|nr:Ger(x)C family spore germination protein [Bacillus sp. (in: firmicutes)]